jgi:carbon monoxide dehydrogenase subunit G
MQLNHRFTVAAPVDETWAAFNDLERVAPCFPGAELTSVDGDDFTGTCKVKLGPISLQYTGSGTFLERDETAHRAVIEAKGKDKRGNGTAGATVTARLTPDGDGTLVEVDTDLNITGKPAQFGRGVIQDVSDRLLDQFVACLQNKLAGPAEEPTAEQPIAAEAAAATQAASTAGAAPTADAGGAAPTADAGGAELNLLTTIGPALLKRFAPPVAGLLLVVWVVRRLRR